MAQGPLQAALTSQVDAASSSGATEIGLPASALAAPVQTDRLADATEAISASPDGGTVASPPLEGPVAQAEASRARSAEPAGALPPNEVLVEDAGHFWEAKGTLHHVAPNPAR